MTEITQPKVFARLAQTCDRTNRRVRTSFAEQAMTRSTRSMSEAVGTRSAGRFPSRTRLQADLFGRPVQRLKIDAWNTPVKRVIVSRTSPWRRRPGPAEPPSGAGGFRAPPYPALLAAAGAGPPVSMIAGAVGPPPNSATAIRCKLAASKWPSRCAERTINLATASRFVSSVPISQGPYRSLKRFAHRGQGVGRKNSLFHVAPDRHLGSLLAAFVSITAKIYVAAGARQDPSSR